MTARQWGWVYLIGLLLFGLTGFIDMWDGAGFPKVKIVSLLAGTAVLMRTLWAVRKDVHR